MLPLIGDVPAFELLRPVHRNALLHVPGEEVHRNALLHVETTTETSSPSPDMALEATTEVGNAILVKDGRRIYVILNHSRILVQGSLV